MKLGVGWSSSNYNSQGLVHAYRFGVIGGPCTGRGAPPCPPESAVCKTVQQEVFGGHSVAPVTSAGSGVVESYQSLAHLRGGRWRDDYIW